MTRGLFWALEKMVMMEAVVRVTFEGLRQQCLRASGMTLLLGTTQSSF